MVATLARRPGLQSPALSSDQFWRQIHSNCRCHSRANDASRRVQELRHLLSHPSGQNVNPAIPDIIGDDTAPSISELNPHLNEMTAIYWLGHHYDEIGNPDFIGFDHYRRFLDWRAMTEDRDRLATLSPLERRKYGFIMELVGGYWFWHEQRHGRLKTKGTRLRFYNISNPTNGTSYPARKIK